MKLFIFGVVALMSMDIGTSPASFSKLNSNQSVSIIAVSPSHIIIMEDEVMLFTDTGDRNDPTAAIEVMTLLGLPMLYTDSCQKQQCLTDLSSLPSGTYVVVLTTVSARIYSQIVIVG